MTDREHVRLVARIEALEAKVAALEAAHQLAVQTAPGAAAEIQKHLDRKKA